MSKDQKKETSDHSMEEDNEYIEQQDGEGVEEEDGEGTEQIDVLPAYTLLIQYTNLLIQAIINNCPIQVNNILNQYNNALNHLYPGWIEDILEIIPNIIEVPVHNTGRPQYNGLTPLQIAVAVRGSLQLPVDITNSDAIQQILIYNSADITQLNNEQNEENIEEQDEEGIEEKNEEDIEEQDEEDIVQVIDVLPAYTLLNQSINWLVEAIVDNNPIQVNNILNRYNIALDQHYPGWTNNANMREIIPSITAERVSSTEWPQYNGLTPLQITVAVREGWSLAIDIANSNAVQQALIDNGADVPDLDQQQDDEGAGEQEDEDAGQQDDVPASEQGGAVPELLQPRADIFFSPPPIGEIHAHHHDASSLNGFAVNLLGSIIPKQ